jgi:hypothetical protein
LKINLIMKTISIILCAALFAVVACDKDSKSGGENEKTYCYTCVSTTTYTGITQGPTTVEQEVCNLTEQGIRNLEKLGTTTVTSTSGDITITTKKVMNCTRK